MPFNENGQFIRVHNWTEDKSNNIPITASRMDAEDDGFATGLSQTFLRDGSVALTGDLKAGNNKLTGLKNGTESTDAATIGQLNTVQGNAVLLTGDQTVAGTKTFTSSPVVPTISADDNSTKVATTAWVNTTGNNVVHLTGAETITGNKTFSNGYKSTHGLLYNDYIIKGTAPSSNTQYINMYMVGDSRTSGDSNALGLFRTYVTTSNIVYSTMQAFKNVASSGASSALRTYYSAAQNKFGVELQALSTGTDTNESMSLSTNATDSPRIPTMGWVNNPATSTNVVHRSDDETISGNKTFINNVTISKTNPSLLLIDDNAKAGIDPQNPISWSIYAKGNVSDPILGNRTYFGAFETSYKNNGTVNTSIYAYQRNGHMSSRISIIYPSSGSPYTYAPTPSLTSTHNDYANQIVTVGYLNDSSSGVVHLTGAQTIAGIKTFTSNIIEKSTSPRIYLVNTTVTKGTAPTATQVEAVQFRDKGENLLGTVQTDYGSSTEGDKTIATKLRVYKASSSTDTANANIAIGYDNSGNVYTYAPTPSSSSDHSTKIATTDWCQTAFANAIGTPRDVTILWGNGTGSSAPTEFLLSEKFTNFEQIGFVCATDSGDFRNICIESTYWLNWLLSNSGSHTVQLGRSGTSNFAIRSYTASSNPSTNTKFKVSYEDGICYYIFGINRKVKTVTDPLA